MNAMRAWFEQICDCGGRLLGTDSELQARALLRQLAEEASGATCRVQSVPYDAWRPVRCELFDSQGRALTCHPLLRSPTTSDGGLQAEVVDLGRGTPQEFTAHRDEIPGRIVLVRHELMFAAGTIHRAAKYRSACEAGAVGFLIAGPLQDTPVAGSGRDGDAGIPAAGISAAAADALSPTSGGFAAAHLIVEAEEGPATAENLLFEMPGQEPEWVVLSAHIDGHDLAESAIDNASGLAVALAVAQELAAEVPRGRRGLLLALFNVEEWSLGGSAHFVEQLPADQREKIALNVNLDSVGVGDGLTALTSGFAGVEPFLRHEAEAAGVPLGVFRPLQMNSDHGNFAQAGIPAFRLVSGFNDHSAATRFVLTTEDTRDKVSPESLDAARRLTVGIVRSALQAPPDEAAAWRSGKSGI